MDIITPVGQILYICSMEITDQTIQKLAILSRLSFSETEMVELRSDLQNMLQFVHKLNELDTSGVEPLLHMTQNNNVYRVDEVKTDFTRETGLKNATLKDEVFFKVPKVIKK